MAPDVDLTPAQRSFLAEHLAGFHEGRWHVSLAGQAGSQRLFYRVSNPENKEPSYILIVWDGSDEDWPRFLAIPAELSDHLDVFPRLFFSDARHGLILEQDLGTETLRTYGDRHANDPDALDAIYRKTLDLLARWQKLDTRLSATISSRSLDFETFMWETDYFARRCVIDFCGQERLLTVAWEKERTALAAEAAALPSCFVHRDFQSENIMIAGSGLRLVDFQGARLGPPAYDVASLLYDPYVSALTPGTIDRLFLHYGTLPAPLRVDRRSFGICAAQRLMQALGAYGNLSIHQGKTRYREYVPIAFKRLQNVLDRLEAFPAIRAVVDRCGTLLNVR
ncbi:MAG: phosphotransferase [Chitinispirillaceae bacterium]|nr:phosphotransferase [Chitinispirillaceae bacterium]